MLKFEGLMLSEISRIAGKYIDLSEKLQKQLTETKQELIKIKKELEERDRGWDAYCQEIEDKMKEEVDEMRAEIINKENMEDLL